MQREITNSLWLTRSFATRGSAVSKSKHISQQIHWIKSDELWGITPLKRMATWASGGSRNVQRKKWNLTGRHSNEPGDLRKINHLVNTFSFHDTGSHLLCYRPFIRQSEEPAGTGRLLGLAIRFGPAVVEGRHWHRWLHGREPPAGNTLAPACGQSRTWRSHRPSHQLLRQTARY